MFIQIIFAALLAVVAAKPGIHSVAYSAPIVAAPAVAAAYSLPVGAAYPAPIAAAYAAPFAAYRAPLAYSAPFSAYSAQVLLK